MQETYGEEDGKIDLQFNDSSVGTLVQSESNECRITQSESSECKFIQLESGDAIESSDGKIIDSKLEDGTIVLLEDEDTMINSDPINQRTERTFSESDSSEEVYLQLWDTAGQERYRALTSAFFRDALGFLLMFDVTDEQSFDNIHVWMERINLHAFTQNPAMVLIGTKSDLVERRVVEGNVASGLAEQLGMKYFETSAVSGENIYEAMFHLIDVIKDNEEKKRKI